MAGFEGGVSSGDMIKVGRERGRKGKGGLDFWPCGVGKLVRFSFQFPFAEANILTN